MSENFESLNDGRSEAKLAGADSQSWVLSSTALDLLKEGASPNSGTDTVSRVSARVSRVGPDSLYPDPGLTPGVALAGVTEADVSKPGYAGGVRSVSAAEKAAVFKEYGLTPVPGKYEVDHYVSLELGGSNDIKNLWPEPYTPAPGAHEKDKVENYLHRQVVDGSMTLLQAQNAETSDWYKVYQQMQKK